MDLMAENCVEQQLVDCAVSVVNLLLERQLSVVTAESCTGGLVAAILSHVPGAAEVFHGSFVTYSKALKVSALDVDEGVLRDQGGVNETVALSMARGALEHSPAHFALAITGVLGPEPDEDGSPAGLIYVATVSIDGVEHVESYRLKGFAPDQVRREAVEQALKLLKRAIGEWSPERSLASLRSTMDQIGAMERVSG